MHKQQPWWVRRRYALPEIVSQLGSSELRQYAGLRFALQASVTSWTTANPSMILLYCRRMKEWSKALTADLKAGTLRNGPAEAVGRDKRQQLEARLSVCAPPMSFEPAKCWPLRVVNCWKGGSAAYFVEQLPDALGGNVPIREVGVTASEGYFALPMGDEWEGGVLWSMGHVLEFIDSAGNVFWSWELKVGEVYRLVISTESGLYRYDIGDNVMVTGYCYETPVIRFVGKAGRFLNAVGEKVNERQIAMAVKDACLSSQSQMVGFTARVRLEQLPFIELAVEGRVNPPFLSAFDSMLQKINIEYASKRSSGRLARPKLCHLKEGAYLRFRENRIVQGAPEGQLKDPIIAMTETEWSEVACVESVVKRDLE